MMDGLDAKGSNIPINNINQQIFSVRANALAVAGSEVLVTGGVTTWLFKSASDTLLLSSSPSWIALPQLLRQTLTGLS
jgi:hypothetical protein